MTQRSRMIRTAVVLLALSVAAPTASAAAVDYKRTGSSTTTTTKVGAKKEEAAAERLERIKNAGIAAVDRRVQDIDRVRQRVDSNNRVTDAHKKAALALLDNAKTGLNNQKTVINNATSVEAARPALKAVVDDYRVYVLLLPQVRNTLALDSVTWGATKVDEAASMLDTVVVSQRSGGKNTAGIENALKKAHDEAKLAKDTASGKADAVLALKANAYPTNKTSLDEMRTTTKTSAAHLKVAASALREARNGLANP